MVTRSFTSRQIKWHHHHHSTLIQHSVSRRRCEREYEKKMRERVRERSPWQELAAILIAISRWIIFDFIALYVGLARTEHVFPQPERWFDCLALVVDAEISGCGVRECVLKCHKCRRPTTNWIIKKNVKHSEIESMILITRRHWLFPSRFVRVGTIILRQYFIGGESILRELSISQDHKLYFYGLEPKENHWPTLCSLSLFPSLSPSLPVSLLLSIRVMATQYSVQMTFGRLWYDQKFTMLLTTKCTTTKNRKVVWGWRFLNALGNRQLTDNHFLSSIFLKSHICIWQRKWASKLILSWPRKSPRN